MAPLRTIFDVVLPGTHDSGAYEIPLSHTTPAGAPAILALPPLSCVLRRTLREFSQTQYSCVLSQLRAGSRYQDFRISRATHAQPKGAADRFWLVHGAVACVPLAEVLADMRAFTAECREMDGAVPTVVTVVRLEGPDWDAESKEELDSRFFELGKEDLYQGSAKGLRDVDFEALPPHLVAGVPGIGEFGRGQEFGTDVWINTYSAQEKKAGLQTQLGQIAPRGERDDLYALGWTVTPQPTDIAKRILSLGFARPSLRTEAENFNSLFKVFAEENKEQIRKRCNVVMFDFITKELSDMVLSLNEKA